MEMGVHCQYIYCKQLDFLSFTCSQCTKKYCLEHKNQKDHECENLKVQKKVTICDICNKTIKFYSDNTEEQILKTHKTKDCPGPSETGKNQQKMKRNCNQPKCFVNLTDINSNHCKLCSKDYCLKHRLPEIHNCDKENKSNPSSQIAKKQKKNQTEEPVNTQCCCIIQ